jgi:hypothetical protein
MDGPEWEFTSERGGFPVGRRGDGDLSYEFFAARD